MFIAFPLNEKTLRCRRCRRPRLRHIFRGAAHGAQRQLELRARDAAVLAKLWRCASQALQVGYIYI